jgi:hypothetical protein
MVFEVLVVHVFHCVGFSASQPHLGRGMRIRRKTDVY